MPSTPTQLAADLALIVSTCSSIDRFRPTDARDLDYVAHNIQLLLHACGGVLHGLLTEAHEIDPAATAVPFDTYTDFSNALPDLAADMTAGLIRAARRAEDEMPRVDINREHRTHPVPAVSVSFT